MDLTYTDEQKQFAASANGLLASRAQKLGGPAAHGK